MNKNLSKSSIAIRLIMSFFFIISCSENITNPILFANILCYAKYINGNWEIVINNEGIVKNISNTTKEDNYPEWSPNGKYIIYEHIASSESSDVYCYDIEKDITIDLTSDAEIYFATLPFWTPDGQKIAFGYHQIGGGYFEYIMEKDGSNKRKIIEQDEGIYSYPSIYFYNDSYNFIYIMDSRKVFKSNIDNTVNEFLFDIYQVLNSSGNDLTIRSFNPITEDLIITKKNSDGILGIASFNLKTRKLATIISPEEGYNLNFKSYSKDYSKFAFLGNKAETDDKEFLAECENGVVKKLVELDTHSNGNHETFSYNPLQFSPDGKYISFSRIIWGSSEGWITQYESLYIVDTTNGNTQFIDTGMNPSWKTR